MVYALGGKFWILNDVLLVRNSYIIFSSCQSRVRKLVLCNACECNINLLLRKYLYEVYDIGSEVGLGMV